MKNVCFLALLIVMFLPPQIGAKSFIFSALDSLSTSDSTLAVHYLNIGEKLYKADQPDSAVVFFDKAETLFENSNDWINYIDCILKKARCYHLLGEYSRAIETYKSTKQLILEKLGEKDILMVSMSNGLTNSYWKLGDYKSAKKYSEESVVIAEEFKNSTDSKVLERVTSAYNLAGIIKFELGKYDEAIYNLEQAVQINDEFVEKDIYGMGAICNTLAVVYSQTGYFDGALEMYEKALEYYSQFPDQYDRVRASIYINIGVTLSEAYGDYDEALLYQDKALSIFLDLFGEANYYTALVYYNKGEFLFKKGNPDEALDFYNRALDSYLSVFQSEEHTDVAMTYNSIGQIYESQSNYEKALEYYQKALSMRLSIFGEQHLNVAKGYNNLGTINRIQQQYEEAINYHKDAIAVQKQIFGEHHPEIADSYNLLGVLFREKGEYEISLNNFQSAMIANVPSFSNTDININPDPEAALSTTRLLESLSYKAETLSLWFTEENSNISVLQSALDTYVAAADLIDIMRSGHKAEGSKLFLAEKSSRIFEEAIEVSIKLNQISGQEKYKDEAYYFCEQSKAQILQEAMTDSRAKNFSGIPDSLIEIEKSLRTDLTFYENQLQEEKYKKEDIDSVKIGEFESRLFSLNRDYQQLVEELEQNYPKYYSSKYFNTQIEVDDVQRSLEDDEALLEYFAGSEAIYLFYFTQNDYEIFTINTDSSFNKVVNEFYSSIKLFRKKEYLNSANKLYNLLIKPVESLIAGKQKLTILPDGRLYYVPFEALITEVDPQNTRDFSNQNYLINKYDISYHYSTSFLLDSNSGLLNNNEGFIGFAPLFNDSPMAELYVAENVRSVYSPDPENDEYRFINNNGEILPLPYSEEELKYILNLFNNNDIPADGYFFDIATKENFISEAGKYKYIHLATHSFVNPEKPQHSGIIMSQSEDTLTSGSTLYSNEIYNLDLNADLVVLSSCESGIGKLVKGEGMMALTRGFLYAGADNIITSLWKVYDKSTSILMKNFYASVIDNNSYSSALRKAKLEMISNSSTSHPVNWSGFVLIGR